METIEVRLPSADRWTKHVTSISPTAKTGHDWDGEWLNCGRLVDLEPGSIIASCKDIGSRKRPEDEVTVRMLLPDGEWFKIASATGKEWAYELREKALHWLAIDQDSRAAEAIAEQIKEWTRIQTSRADRLDRAKDMLSDLPALVTAMPSHYLAFPSAEKKEDSDLPNIFGETPEEKLKMATEKANERIKYIEIALATATEKLALWTARAPEPQPATTEPENNPLKDVTTDDLIAELARRGFAVSKK